jgi:hypothetical protein
VVAGRPNEVFVAGAVTGGWKFLHHTMSVIFLLGGRGRSSAR